MEWREFLKQNGYTGKVMGFDYLKVTIGERKPPFSEEQKARIEQRWSKVLERNPKAFSKQILAINDVVVNAQIKSVSIDAYVTGYKEYSMTRDDQNENDRVWSAGASGLTYVEENRERIFIFAERTRNTLPVGGNIESVPSGFTEMSPALDAYDSNPFRATILAKAQEELGLSKEQVKSQRYLSLGQVRKFDILYQDMHVDFLVELQEMSWKEIEQVYVANMVKKRESGEVIRHKGLIPVREGELIAFIEKQRERIAIRTRFTLDTFVELGLIRC